MTGRMNCCRILVQVLIMSPLLAGIAFGEIKNGSSRLQKKRAVSSENAIFCIDRCVKSPYKTYGVCMKSVNEYGTQQYDLPRLDSINPKYEGDCDFDTDCPIGFYCHRKFKVCVKR